MDAYADLTHRTTRHIWRLRLHDDGRAEVLSCERVVQTARSVTGLGDVVERVAEAVGVRKCANCEERRQALNAAVPFRSREG